MSLENLLQHMILNKNRNGTTYGDVETGLIADAKLDFIYHTN